MPFGLELGAGLVEGPSCCRDQRARRKLQALVHWVGTGLRQTVAKEQLLLCKQQGLRA